MRLLQEIFLICSSKQISRAVSCQLLKVKTCLKRLNKVSISPDNNTLLMSKHCCHTLLHLNQLKIVILLGWNQKIPRGGERNLNNRASLPPHSPVGQQGISRDNNSFFLYLNIFSLFSPKAPRLNEGNCSCLTFIISNNKKCLLHKLFNQDFYATSFASSNKLSIINFHL